MFQGYLIYSPVNILRRLYWSTIITISAIWNHLAKWDVLYLSNLSTYFSTCFKVQWTRKLIFYVFFLFVIWFLGWFVSWKIILLPKRSWFVKIFWDELSSWWFDVIEFVNLPIVQIVYSYYYQAAYFTDTDCVIWEKRHKNDEIGYCVLGSVINLYIYCHFL